MMEYNRYEARIRDALYSSMIAIARTIEIRDPFTSGHQKSVAELAILIAQEMKLPEQTIEGLRVASLIHDLGKLHVPSEILSKPGKLSLQEFELVKEHPLAGYNIISDVPYPWPVAQIILQHHERMDGSGYPYGLKGEKIFLEARILAVADVVEAMTSHRPYRPALPLEKAMEEIRNNSRKLYDPEVVHACFSVFHKRYKPVTSPS